MTQKIPLTGVYNGSTLLTIGEYLSGDTINVSFMGTGTANANTYLSGDGSWKGISTGSALNSNIIAYDSRNNLRSLAASNNDLQLVESLGLFRFNLGSTEPDDDETCFATSTGRWIVECPHWDLVDAEYLPILDKLNELVLNVPFTMLATSIGTLATYTQTVYVPNAAIGDAVHVIPNTTLDARLSLYAYVSSQGTVTVVVGNPSASSATLTAGNWIISIINQI